MFLEYLLLVLLVSSKESTGMRKISNGFQVNITDYPFLVKIMVRTRFGVSHCTGSYIHSYWVLSAAHCYPLRHPALIHCCMGEERADLKYCKHRRLVRQVITFENNDVAMMKLSEPFPLGPEVDFRVLLAQKIDLADILNQTCHSIGWGMIEQNVVSHQLLASEVKPTDLCNTDQRLCAIGDSSGPCGGDSGSPLICNEIQVGVLSSSTAKVCKTEKVVYFYTRADAVQEFINRTVNGIVIDRNRASRLKFYFNDVCLILCLFIF